jgi:hypothetical protein
MSTLRPWRGTNRKYGLAAVVGLLLLGVAFAWVDRVFYPYGAPPPGAAGDQGENGLWLRYTWYFGEYTKSDEAALATRLRENRIRYAYVHVRTVLPDGRLKFRDVPSARHLVAELHRDAPGVRVLAWIYVDADRHDHDRVDPTRVDVRQRMAAEARSLTTDAGFDGVQWDYEVCPDNDRGLLDLLLATRAVLPRGKTIAVAAPLWSPPPLCDLGYGWSDAYLARIAALCDQVAVMDYDSGITLPRAYVWLTAAQVRHVCHAAVLGNPACRILIGVPTYVQGGGAHDARTENLALALRGVRAGLAALSPDERATFAGVAPFADYTTTPADWRTYRDDWLPHQR